MNYAEEKAYWYLRLNGFFVIPDFVLHNKHGDTDLLGIRLSHTSEFVEGQRLKEDIELVSLFHESGCNIYRNTACVIAEVKGGRSSIQPKEIHEKFDLETLKYALNRIGLFRVSESNSIAERLHKAKWVKMENNNSIHKVLFVNKEAFTPSSEDRFSVLTNEHITEFIENRMSLGFKIRDWSHFDSNFVQETINRVSKEKAKNKQGDSNAE